MTTHTHSATIHSNSPAVSDGLIARYRALYSRSETRSSPARLPHPGDILYWVGCVGAISALLFVATR